MRPSLALLGVLPRLVSSLAKGDNALLKAIVGLIEESGVKVVGAHEIVPDLLAGEGVMTRAKPTAADRSDLAAAFAAAKAIGALDIGQAAVAIGGRVIALEGIEGTDGLLARTVSCATHGRLAGKKRGVLVKCAKPGQELRADMPAIGPQTVTAAHAAGLAGIGVEAGRSLILDYETVSRRADAARPFRRRPAGRRRVSGAGTPLRIAIVAGEESGDLLGADLVRALRPMSGRPIELVGVGGRHLQEQGLKACSIPREIALMGFTRDRPRPAAADQADRRDGARDRRRQAGLPGHHRQPGIQPARRRKVRAAAPGDPDRPLCLPERLGLAAGPRAGDAAACRSRALPAAVRAGRARAPRRPARHLSSATG